MWICRDRFNKTTQSIIILFIFLLFYIEWYSFIDLNLSYFQIHRHMTSEELRHTFHVDHHDLGNKSFCKYLVVNRSAFNTNNFKEIVLKMAGIKENN